MHPILFYLPTPWGNVPIYSYGVMLGTSLIIAWYLIMWLGTHKENLDRELMSNTFMATAICAIVGARVLYILTNLNEFHSVRELFALRNGGLVAYGGFLGGTLGSWGYLKLKKVPLGPWADCVAPTLGTGLMFTRIGCYLYGCDFGKQLSASAPDWLKRIGTFPHWNLPSTGLACAEAQQGSPAWAHHVRTAHLPLDAAASLPVHPTQLYESLAGLVIFGIAMFTWSRRSFRGQVLLVAAMSYSVWRFGVEFLRDDPERGALLGLSTSQLISAALLPLCAFAYYRLRARGLQNNEAQTLREVEAASRAQLEKEAADKAAEKSGAGALESASGAAGTNGDGPPKKKKSKKR